MSIMALIPIGGQGSRLKTGGVPVPISKSFLLVNGKPILYWNLMTLHKAGIDSVVISAGNDVQFNAGIIVVKSLPFKFRKIVFRKHDNLGCTGIPYQSLHDLSFPFIYQMGHQLCSVEHIRSLIKSKNLIRQFLKL